MSEERRVKPCGAKECCYTNDKDYVVSLENKVRFASEAFDALRNYEKRMMDAIADGSLMFTSKQDVVDHLALLNKALEFWEYD